VHIALLGGHSQGLLRSGDEGRAVMLLVSGEGWNRDGAYPLSCCAPPYPRYGNLEVSHCWTVVTWPWIIRSDVVWIVRRNQEGEAREWMGGYKPGFELAAPGQEKQTCETSQDSLVCVFKRRGKHRCGRHFVLLKWSRGLELNFCHAVSQISNLSSDKGGFIGGSQIRGVHK